MMDAGIWRQLIEGTFADPVGKNLIRSLAQHADFGFALMEAQGYCLYANRAMCEMTGFSAQELSSRPLHDLLCHHRPDGSPFPKEESPLHKAFTTGASFTQDKELLFYRKDGSRFFAHCTVNPVIFQEKTLCTVMEVRDYALLRKSALQKLGTELTNRFAMEVAEIGTWERDMATDMVRQSPQTSRILGLGTEQTIVSTTDIDRLILPEDLPVFKSTLQAALEKREPFNLEFRIRRGDGQIRWLTTRGMGIRNAAGKIGQVVGVMFDITERKQAEEKLLASQLSYKLATEAANVGTWELEFATNAATVSATAAQILGLPSGKSILTEHEWQNMIFPDDREMVIGVQQKAMSSGEPFVVDFRMCRPDQSVVWVSSRGVVKKDRYGHPMKSMGVIIDITKKRQNAEALQQINQRLSLILDSSSEGICGIEVDHHCTFINQAGAAMLGYAPDELIGMPVHEAFYARKTPEQLTEQECKLFKAISKGATVRSEEDLFWRKDGTSFPVLYSLSPMVADGKPSGVVVTYRDISEKKKAEERERSVASQILSAAEANAKFKTFFEQGSFFCGVVALDGSLIEANHLSFKLCGYKREEQIGRKFWECGWWNRSTEVMEKVKKSVLDAAAGKSSRQEIAYFWANGSEHVTEMTLAPITDANGKFLYVAATGTDITEKIQYAKALQRSEERFRSLSEFSPDAIFVELHGICVYANIAAAHLLGAKAVEDLIGRRTLDFLDAEFHEIVRAHRAMNKDERKKSPLLDLKIRRLDGAMAFAQAACGEVIWEDKPAIQIMLRDVTELKETQDKLRHISERLQLAIEGSGEGIWDWDILNDRFTFAGGLNKILGRPTISTLSEAEEWHRAIHPDDYERVLSTFREALEEKTPLYECEYRLRTRSGHWKWIWARGIIVDRDKHGRPTMMTGTLTDITARKESDELAWRHANLDALTSLPNRRLFRERLEMELLKVRRSSHQLAVLFIDLDGFKQVNDLYGHDAGDLLLMEAAHRLKNCVRETDTVARLGGDEFTIILTELVNLDHVEFVCQKILSSLAETFHLGKEIGYISGSIGVSLYPMDAETPEDLIRKADQAMYAAKHTGKNQFNYFTKEMDDRAHNRLRITNELRHALQFGQLAVHYQPVVDLKSGEIAKAEALLRWHHPILGNIEPAEFIPMAEESGLIKQIGNWVFKEAAICCKQCKDQTGKNFQIGVNKSPIQFMAREMESNWLHFLFDQGLPASSISIEITEGVLLHASARVEDKLTRYQNAGVEIALDDFGTGYSSMSYLQKFHIDYVKIDQSFVQNIGTDPNSRTIAETIIMMAHKLGQKVIAEGIETEEQLDFLKRVGCDYGQGYYFSYPVPAERLVRTLAGDQQSQRWPM
ncbi:PAS domain S-box protein [Oxalobacteraceae bacterium R-40]|uniref:PAS domain S-box protein n=1 Tax=Keguizhuia sedimenti TaxID=3064264 RepID=A0ABU1BLW1_9BURK|nr:PAS domain S-box protein [Oxalobacteraceae bacterium R-40]